ncbi:haloacid dehalogenase [Pedobacter montanisoli]|uniref:Haloacid dehalogenase n=1 Tax=Pedobacter montanisoli TaxID=2923277 RepID=A0ABS9ZZ49_9SPHI|nr:haloacid dehalogenase [Pedobacter montanisoli]MCJ0743575.1 haloacid dehalogenase [Pedobacter montanisoli]
MTLPISNLIEQKESFFFCLDDVLYPEKDYLLQVYYLFAEFMAYTEQLDSKQIIACFKEEYEKNGSADIFDKIANAFNIDSKYRLNFDRLHENARLPLKLLLYNDVLAVLQEIAAKHKNIFIVAKGNMDIAINKIKQIEWNGLERSINLYFLDEYANNWNKLIEETLINTNEKLTDTLVIYDAAHPVNFFGDKICVTEILSIKNR